MTTAEPSRRQFLRKTAITGASVGAAVATGTAGDALAAAPKTNVAIFGAGIAGLSAALELAERGFRFFPGFHRNLTDTMRRIPFPGNANGTR